MSKDILRDGRLAAHIFTQLEMVYMCFNNFASHAFVLFYKVSKGAPSIRTHGVLIEGRLPATNARQLVAITTTMPLPT